MAKARQIGLDRNDAIYVAMQDANGYRLFSSFHTFGDFWEYYVDVPTKEKKFYWIDYSASSDETAKLMLDVEWTTPSESSEEDPLRRLTAINTAIKTMMDRNVKARVVCSSRRKAGGYYHSYHMYFEGVIFESNVAAGTFVREMIEKYLVYNPLMYEESGTKSKLIIDTGIYTKHRQIRIPGSIKHGSKVLEYPEYVLTKDFVWDTRMSGRYDEITEHKYPHVQKTLAWVNLPAVQMPSAQSLAQNDEIAHEIHRLLQLHGDESTTVYQVEKGFYRGINCPANGRKCLIGGEICKNNRCQIRVIETNVFYYCTGTSRHEFCASMFIGSIAVGAIQWTPENKFVMSHKDDIRSTWGVIRETEFDDDTQYVQPFTKTLGERALVCIAGMGSGKTSRARDIVNSYGPDKRILVVTPRKTLTWALHSSFDDFVHYSEKVYNANRMIIQYESLHKLCEQRKFDIIIIDEVRSVCENIFSQKTNGRNMELNVDVLRAFMDHSEWTICMDADTEIDGAVPSFLTSVFPRPNDIHVVRYKRTNINRTLRASIDGDRWHENLLENIRYGIKCGIVCRTKKRASELEIYIKNNAPSKRILAITSDSDDEIVRSVMDDVNGALDDVDVLIYTSKLTVGVDITREWGKCFVDSTGEGCSARDICQMIGRFRNLEDEEVPVYSKRSDPTFMTYNDAVYKSEIYSEGRDEEILKLRSMLRNDVYFVDDHLTTTPSWIKRLFVHTRTDKIYDFNYNLYRICDLKGWNVFVEGRNDDTYITKDEDVLNSRIVAKDQLEQLRKAVYDEAAEGDIHTLQFEADQLVANDVSTLRDRMMVDTCKTLMTFPGATYDDFKVASREEGRIRNYVKATTLSTEQIIRMTNNRLHKERWSDTTMKIDIIQYQMIKDCLVAIGIDGVGDTYTEVGEHTIHEHGAFIVESCNRSLVARNGSTKSKTTNALQALRRELRAVFGVSITLKNKRRKRYSLTRKSAYDRLIPLSQFGYDFGDELPEPVVRENLRERKRPRCAR
jgi:hypothetical protein